MMGEQLDALGVICVMDNARFSEMTEQDHPVNTNKTIFLSKNSNYLFTH